MKLETLRTVLRPFEEKDLEDIFEYCSQPGVGESAGWRHHESIEESRKALEIYIQKPEILAIELKASCKVVGHIGVYPDSLNGDPLVKELGFVLNKNYHRQGIMSEVVTRVLTAIFEDTDIAKVYACCFTDNHASKGLIEKCGFTLEGRGKYFSGSLNQRFRSLEYAYLREDWERRCTGDARDSESSPPQAAEILNHEEGTPHEQTHRL